MAKLKNELNKVAEEVGEAETLWEAYKVQIIWIAAIAAGVGFVCGVAVGILF